MGVLIGSGELSWAIVLRLSKLFPIHAPIKKFIMDHSQRFANKFMKDPRNYNYVPHILWLSIWAPTLYIWAIYRAFNFGFEWWFFFTYHFLRIGPRFRFFAHLHVLVHKEGHDHKGFFKGPFNICNYLCQWWVGPFYGQVPNSYAMAHNKIHHRYDNQLDDVHTNLDLDRSKLWSFIVYLPRFAFYWIGVSPLRFFVQNKEWRFAVGMFSGMAYHLALFVASAVWVNPIFAIAYIGYPLFEDIIFFGGISYLWHAWVDPDDITNQHVNSVTILKGKDNIWNEDFHVVHHTSPATHWTNYPKHFEEHREEYAKCKATIFQDTEEGELLFLMLSGNFDRMADFYVDLEGKLNKEQKKELIMRRLTYVVRKDE